ncbi:MAG: flagellar basal body rod protein FlgC [Alphaproteobacteria bacterium]|nr:flagellar basal body rod protein FlgC [Alphaproteobacteria bacterium]
MSSEILNAMQISAMGMKAQGARIRVVTENVANADTTGKTPGSDPYRRQTITFKNELDRKNGFSQVMVDKISTDKKALFPVKYIPDHPAADDKGYVKMPNVNSLIELMDIREAQRSYEANMGMIEQSRSMIMRTIELLNA